VPQYGTAQGKRTLVPQTTMSVCSPVNESAVHEITAILDSGAAMTAVPSALIPKLGDSLEKDWREVTSPFGEKQLRPVYTVHLKIGSCEFKDRKVVVIERPYALVGRDILNSYKVVLDGPHLQWTHDSPDA
jgi:predicted aspartyl protease